ncbi:IS3 family transposase [Paenibacillus sp. Y412MC10]|uniref:IS3 family transposase n=1 Tax=Geobacillus sp. (strain Y412MC10) TaxID=481743 RepID=UPI0011AB7715
MKYRKSSLKAKFGQKKTRGLLLHSDRGFQSTSKPYSQLLIGFFGHLKSEAIRLHRFTSQKQLMDEVHRYIRFYNNQ